MKPIKLPEFYFTFHTYCLRFLGIEVIKEKESIIYRIYSFLALSFTTSFVFSECIELAFHRDFNTLVIVCNYAISHFLGMIKVVVFYTNRKQIGNLMKSLHYDVYKPNETRGGPFEKEVIQKTIEQTTVQMIIYGLSIVIVLTLGMTSSMYCRLTQPQEMWRLPFVPISLVKHTTISPRFEMAFLFQAFGIFMISLCVWSVDVTIISVIAQVGTQIRIFEKSVRNYETRALINKRKKNVKHEELVLSETLYDSIEHHLTIVNTVETVEYLCSNLALCVFLANLILLCLLMYHTSLMPINSVGFVQYLDYCFLIAIQVFLYCWWGNELTLANEALALAAAETYNPEGTRNRAKALKLMIIRAQRPLFLTAGKFAPLSLETYKGIIKGSFSYFMVLRQVNRN